MQVANAGRLWTPTWGTLVRWVVLWALASGLVLAHGCHPHDEDLEPFTSLAIPEPWMIGIPHWQ